MILLLMPLLYCVSSNQMTLAPTTKQVGCVAMFVGILAPSSGFFLHMIVRLTENGNCVEVCKVGSKPAENIEVYGFTLRRILGA